MNAEVRDLHKALEAAKILRRNIAAMVSGDDIAAQDTFEGETTLDLEIRAAILANDEDQIMVDGIKEREKDLKERRRRAEDRIEARRGFIEQAMAIAGWETHRADIATVTLGNAKPRLEIDDEAEIPTQFWERQEPALNKQNLLAVLTEREKALRIAREIADDAVRAARLKAIDDIHPPIPGCHLETGGVNLTIRRK